MIDLVWLYLVVVLSTTGLLMAIRVSFLNRIKRKPISCNVCMSFWISLSIILYYILRHFRIKTDTIIWGIIWAFATIPLVIIIFNLIRKLTYSITTDEILNNYFENENKQLNLEVKDEQTDSEK